MPKLAYIVPLSAILVAALSLFFSPNDEIRFARVIGGPTDQAAAFRGRIQVLRENLGVALPEVGASVRLRVEQGGHQAERALLTGPEGWVEFDVPRLQAEPIRLQVIGERLRVLAEGEVQLSTSRWLSAAGRRTGALSYQTKGGYSVCIFIPSGVLAVPFAAELIVQLREGEQLGLCRLEGPHAYSGGTLQFEVEGGELLSDSQCQSDAQGRCLLRVRPFHHNVDLKLKLKIDEHIITMVYALPVVPGAFGLESLASSSSSSQKKATEYRIRSPVSKSHVWFSFVSESGRGRGGVLTLLPEEDGSASTRLTVQAVERSEAYLVLSSDADGRSSSSVGYPLDGRGTTLDAWDAYLLDGAPRARGEQQRRQRRVRYALAGYASLSLLLALILFFRSIKHEQMEIDRRLGEVGADATSSDRRALPLVVAVLCVFFVFSLTLVWIVTR